MAEFAFVAAADLGNNGGATNNYSPNYTCGAGTNRLLIVAFAGDSSVDDFTGVTYDGAAMTLAVKQVDTGSDRFTYVYFLVNPASGSKVVSISCTAAHYILALAADYTGAQQSGQPDNTGIGSGTTSSITLALTPVADRCWTWLVCENNGGGWSAGAGAVHRAQDETFDTVVLLDRNAAVTPPGSVSMTATCSPAGATSVYGSIASFVPAPADRRWLLGAH